jgi:hypothetical protein
MLFVPDVAVSEGVAEVFSKPVHVVLPFISSTEIQDGTAGAESDSKSSVYGMAAGEQAAVKFTTV